MLQNFCSSREGGGSINAMDELATWRERDSLSPRTKASLLALYSTVTRVTWRVTFEPITLQVNERERRRD